MSNLTSSLTVRLNDDVSGPAAKAAGSLRGLGTAGDALKKLASASPEAARLVRQLEQLQAQAEKIKAFRESLRSLGDAGAGFRAARNDVSRLGVELAQAKTRAEALKGIRSGPANPNAEADRIAASRDVRRIERELRAATATLTASKTAYFEQGQAVRAAQAAMTSAVGPVRNLRAAEAGIAAATEAANAALGRQPALMAAAAQKAERLSQAGRDLARSMSEAGRRQEQMISSSRRLTEGLSAPARAAAQARTAELEAVATRREERRVERLAHRREAVGVLAGAGAIKAASVGKRIGLDAVTSVAEFDIATRKQREFNDLADADQVPLQAQAKRIGQETQFSNIDVVKAQTASMQGLPAGFGSQLKAEVAAGIVDNVRDYATLMETDLKDGSETIRGYLQQTGKDISSKEKALDEARKATNQMVKMAKLGGMNGEDVSQFLKFAGAPGTSAGLSTDTMLTLGALARRGGLRGDEAGVFMRSTASKLVSPTTKGIAALNAAGINHSDFVRMPDKLSTGALENQFQTSTGKSFTPEVRQKVEAINTNKEIVADRAKYTAAIVAAVGDVLGKKKDGTVRASDAKVAAKAAGDFHKVSATSVDAEGLLDKVMSSNMTLPQLNAFLTDKHGGKGSITGRQWEDFKAGREQIKAAGDDPNYARAKAQYVQAGVGGSLENMKGSFENFTLQVGVANAGLIKLAADGIGNAVDGFSKMSTTAQQVTSLTAAAGVAALGGWGALKLAGALLGKGGGAVALTGSAVALDGSAAALTAAAARLGVAGAVGAAPGAAATVAGASAATAAGVVGAGVATLAIGAAAAVVAAKQMPEIIDQRGAAGFDAATGFTPDANPMEGMAPDKPWAMEWLKKKLPSIFGAGDAPATMPTKAEAVSAAPAVTASAPPLPTKAEAVSAAPAVTAPAPPLPTKAEAVSAAPAVATPAPPLPTKAEAVGTAKAASSAAGAAGSETATLSPAPDPAKVAEATAQLASYRQELQGIKADLATGLDMPGLGSGMEARKAELEAMIEGVEARLKALGATTIAPQVDASALDGIGTKSDEAAAKLTALSATTVTPQVSTTALDALIAKANQAAAALTRLAGLAASANSSIASVRPGSPSSGSVRQAISDNHTSG